MPQFLPGAVSSGLLAVMFVMVLRVRAGKPRLSIWKLGLIGIAAAFAIPWALTLSSAAWRAVPGLPAPPIITFDQVFIGAWVALLVLAISHRTGKRPLVPVWAGLLTGVVVAVLLPPLLYLVQAPISALRCVTTSMVARAACSVWSNPARSPISAPSRSPWASACPARLTPHPARRLR